MKSQTKRYFEKFYNGITSAFKGMGVTFAHLGRTPVTVCYPDVDVEKQLPERYRGILEVKLDICVSCRICERTCPIDCIVIEDVKCEKTPVPTKDGSRNMFKMKNPVRFDVDIAKCMFCGFCQEACPTGAIRHTKRFSGTVFNFDELIYHFVSAQDRERFLKIEKQLKESEAAKKESGDKKEGDK